MPCLAHERRRAAAIVEADRLKIKGKSAAEISRALRSSHGVALSRCAVIGAIIRLNDKRDADARDLEILKALDAGADPAATAARFRVSVPHVQKLASECPL